MKWSPVALCLIMLVSCTDKPISPSVSTEDSVDTTETTTTSMPDTLAKKHFPVQDFLLSEIRFVDSLPIGIMKYVTRNGKADSGYIKANEFHLLAREFISPELEEDHFSKTFKETSFFDRSIESSTFTYSPVQEGTEIKRIDVLAKESNGYTRINSIYIEKEISEQGTRRIKKLYWKAGKSFQIISPGDTNGKNESVIKVVWNFWE